MENDKAQKGTNVIEEPCPGGMWNIKVKSECSGYLWYLREDRLGVKRKLFRFFKLSSDGRISCHSEKKGEEVTCWSEQASNYSAIEGGKLKKADHKEVQLNPVHEEFMKTYHLAALTKSERDKWMLALMSWDRIIHSSRTSAPCWTSTTKETIEQKDAEANRRKKVLLALQTGDKLAFGISDRHYHDSQFNTLLHLYIAYCRNLNKDLLTHLIVDLDVDVEAKNSDGVTALQLAVERGRLDVVQFFLEELPQHKRPDIDTRKGMLNNKENLLHSAAAAGNKHLLSYLIKNRGINPGYAFEHKGATIRVWMLRDGSEVPNRKFVYLLKEVASIYEKHHIFDK
ncbi:hypothetical protein QOT17_013454 [Balamuthia mandrillaris]